MAGTVARIGSLREPITIKRNLATGKNAYGERLGTASSSYIATAWAAAEPLGGEEIVKSGLTVEKSPVMFTIRWRADKTPKPSDRVVWRTENYDVISVNELDGHRRFWSILAVKVV